MFCYAVLCYAALCCVLLCCLALCFTMLRSAVFCWAALCCVLLCGAVLCRFNMLACCGQGGVLTNSIFFARGKSPSICLAARRDQEVCTLPVVELIQRSWCDPGHASLQPQP